MKALFVNGFGSVGNLIGIEYRVSFNIFFLFWEREIPKSTFRKNTNEILFQQVF